MGDQIHGALEIDRGGEIDLLLSARSTADKSMGVTIESDRARSVRHV